MPTIQDVLQRLSQTLVTLYEAPEAQSMAEWVLQHLLKASRFELLQRRKEIFPESLESQLHDIQQRLLQHQPIQYVLGEASFYGRDFLVTPAVLIPRPETEELVQLVIKAFQHHPNPKLLDIGTGSGCIPITLAAELPTAELWGLDVSADALNIAKRNAETLGQKVTWLQQDILQEIPAVAPASLDAVISNPPYVLEEEKQLMRENVLDFEPHLALFVPNHDPLLFYRRIAHLAQHLLKPGGRLFFEINERYAQETQDMLQESGYQDVQILQDLRGKERMTLAVWPK
ncbi:peptide chain release factor N(5)-glutamine methyltransferase [Rufibacter sp. LB8]|uniref:peptide chain release factor N(5)-glutamine methyltransferase n=1 Tax=Rufibacter sp. LB8 TaxID=2777781 RepID=UPI00178C5A27|nr:peptide chain release factor N(5)-glutamine methyltransferase [Rufibacter sp. LB8]